MNRRVPAVEGHRRGVEDLAALEVLEVGTADSDRGCRATTLSSLRLNRGA